MNTKLKNIYYTLGANILTFLMGIITAFVIPKSILTNDYAYIKIFAFYITYVGISHLGFLDGIYIKYGAYDYKDIPKERFRGYFKYLLSLQIIESIILIMIVSALNIDSDRSFIMVLTIINMVIMNLTTFFAFIHQFTKRFKLFSVNLVINKLIYVFGALIFIYSNMLGYKPFVILQTLINLLILFIYIYINKELVFGKSDSIIKNLRKYLKLSKSGFFIMIGNFMGIFILGLDKLFIDIFFEVKDFAMYSFAYTLIALFFILVNSITTVIYPYLSRMNSENSAMVYSRIRIGLSSMMSVVLVGYFVLKAIVINFLPKYIDSLDILIFLVPTILYSSQINILIANYYKILKETKAYTKNNLVAFAIGLVTNIIAYVFFKSSLAIAMATLISFAIWLLYSDCYFAKKIGIKFKKATILEVSTIIIFIICANMEDLFIGAIIYISMIIAILSIFYFKDLKECFYSLKEK